jgi:hypothetical protein
VRKEALADITKAIEVVEGQLKSDEKIAQAVKTLLELNDNAEKNPIEGYEDPKVETKPIPFREMTPKQQFNNVKLDMEVIRADLILNKGMTDFHCSNYLAGAYNLRKSWKAYERLYDVVKKTGNVDRNNDSWINPDIVYGIKTGVGMFYFLVSILPSTITAVLSVLGFTANRDVGLEMLREVSMNSGLYGPGCLLILSVNYLFIPRAFADKNKALDEFAPILEKVLDRFPRGSLFLFMASHYYKKRGEINTSNACLETAIDSAKEAFDGCAPNTYLFELAQNYQLLAEFERSKEILEKIVHAKEEFDTRGVAALELSITYQQLGQQDKADELIKTLDKYIVKGSRMDKYTAEKNKIIEKLLKKKEAGRQELSIVLRVAHYEMLYLRRDLANLNPEQVEPLLESFRKEVGDYENNKEFQADTIAACHVIEGCLLWQLGAEKRDASKVKEHYAKALALGPKIQVEKQWMAFGNYESAEVLYFENKGNHTDKSMEQVQKYLDTAYSYKGYPLEDILRTRIQLAIKQVKDERKQLQK